MNKQSLVKLNHIFPEKTGINKNGNLVGKIKKEILSKNYLVAHKPFYAHAFKAITKVNLLAFADGKRGGRDYEKDTFRLEKKLI